MIRWDIELPSGQRFTDPRYASLLESARQHLALFRTAGFGSHSRCSDESLRTYFQCLRTLIRWMIEEHIARFADLDSDSLARFTRTVRGRRGYIGPTITRETLRNHYSVLIGLHRHRHSVRDSIQVDPFPGVSARAATASRREDRKAARYTPDAVAVPLIQGAIELLADAALPILIARERAVHAYTQARASGKDRRQARGAALEVLSTIDIDTPRGAQRLDSYHALPLLIDLLYGACFVLLSYLVGPRVSEILHLKSGCVHPFADSGSGGESQVATITGAIYKAESYHGRPHQWIAPLAAAHAIAVLEALSASHRARSARTELWLRPRVRYFALDEWFPDRLMTLRVSDTKSANERMNRLAHWLQVPHHAGRLWRLSSHQGRKTFARFIALRDRTALYALAQHLGHRDVRQTDQGYVGNDYQLSAEIDAAVLDASVSAWEQMLAAPTLGGRMGTEVLARRPRFRGAHAKGEIRAYARMLAETGLTLGVCEWGYCVYREEFSACHGTATAPDPVRREPSTCFRCKNFCVTDAHRPYWLEQLDRYEQLLNDPRLPTQTLRIARSRLDEARVLIRAIDSPVKEARHAQTTRT